MKKSLLVILTLIMASGCASTIQKTLQLSVGMSKSEVIQIMGNPESSKASDGAEFLIYKLQPGTSLGVGAVCGMAGLLTIGIAYADPRCTGGKEEEHFVKLESGKVVSYGRIGDFDPALNINIRSK